MISHVELSQQSSWSFGGDEHKLLLHFKERDEYILIFESSAACKEFEHYVNAIIGILT
jgi:hypothetical protein